MIRDDPPQDKCSGQPFWLMFSGVNVHAVSPKWSHTTLGRLCSGWKDSLFHPKQHTSAAHVPVCTLYCLHLTVHSIFVPEPMPGSMGVPSQLCRKQTSKESKMTCSSWSRQVQFQDLIIFSSLLNHQDTVGLRGNASVHLKVLPGADTACEGLHQGLQELQTELPSHMPWVLRGCKGSLHNLLRVGHCPITCDSQPTLLLLEELQKCEHTTVHTKYLWVTYYYLYFTDVELTDPFNTSLKTGTHRNNDSWEKMTNYCFTNSKAFYSNKWLFLSSNTQFLCPLSFSFCMLFYF